MPQALYDWHVGWLNYWVQHPMLWWSCIIITGLLFAVGMFWANR